MLSKYGALIRRNIGVMLEYRVSMLIWMLSSSLPLIMLAVWLSLAQDGPVGNYSAPDFVAYYLLALYVREMTAVWVSWELDSDIRHGELAIKLLHPMNPIHDYIATNWADKLVRVVLLTPLLALAVLLVPGVQYAVSPLNIFLFLLTMATAWYLRFMLQFNFGLLSFWISQATTIQDFFWMLFLLLGGVVAPLDLLPGWLAALANWLPFRYSLSFPIEIMQGRLAPADLWGGLAVTAVWVVLFHLLYLWLWRKGLHSFGAFGA